MEYECTDRILVAANLFEQYKMGIWQSRLIYIQNSINEAIAGYIYNLHPEPDILYVPTWMYRLFTIHTSLSLAELKISECDRIVFEPFTHEFVETESWKEQLSIAISKYITLIPNSQIYIPLNGSIYPLRIKELHPVSDCIAYKIKKNSICDVSIAAPTIAYTEDDTPDIPFLVYPRRNKKRTIIPFSGCGRIVGGPSPPKDCTPAQMSYAAVLQRLGRRR
jgi:hypothetical protein